MVKYFIAKVEDKYHINSDDGFRLGKHDNAAEAAQDAVDMGDFEEKVEMSIEVLHDLLKESNDWQRQ